MKKNNPPIGLAIAVALGLPTIVISFGYAFFHYVLGIPSIYVVLMIIVLLIIGSIKEIIKKLRIDLD